MSEKRVRFLAEIDALYFLLTLGCIFSSLSVYDSQWFRFQFGTIFSTVPYNFNNLQPNLNRKNIVSQ